MKKILLSVLMMSLCGTAFAAPEGFDYSVLDKIKIDCSRYNIEGDKVRLPNNKLLWLPKPQIEEFQAKMRFQSTLDVNRNSLSEEIFDVLYLLPNHVTEKTNSHCGKSLSEYMKYNKTDLLDFANLWYQKDDIHNKLIVDFFK